MLSEFQVGTSLVILGRIHAASSQVPYFSTVSARSLQEFSEFEHLILLDTLGLNQVKQQRDDEDDEYNEFLHL